MATSRAPGSTSVTTRPPRRISPPVISSRPAALRRSVVFPQPDGPTSTINSPCATSRSTWASASVPSGKRLETFSKLSDAISGSLPGGSASRRLASLPRDARLGGGTPPLPGRLVSSSSSLDRTEGEAAHDVAVEREEDEHRRQHGG